MRKVHNVERVLERLGIVVVRRGGSRLWALCPYHDDKTATNWMMRSNASPDAGKQWCFACKRGGDLCDLVIEKLGLGDPREDFGELRDAALEWLALDELATPPPRAIVVVPSPVRQLGFELPREVIVEPVEQWPAELRDYLLSTRRITVEQADRWRFGHATEGRLHDRVVIVARDGYGIPTTYSARAARQDALRYLTPSDEEQADKAAIFGAELWGEDRRVVYVTEGAFNALALERELHATTGVWVPIAALMGSRIHARHVLALSTFEEAVLVLDPDRAGEQATAKLRGALERRMRVRQVRLPRGTDADALGSGLGLYLRRQRAGWRSA